MDSRNGITKEDNKEFTGNAEKRAQRSLESFKSPESSTTLSESSDL